MGEEGKGRRGRGRELGPRRKTEQKVREHRTGSTL
jgi:hypothetical protein